MQIKQANRIL